MSRIACTIALVLWLPAAANAQDRPAQSAPPAIPQHAESAPEPGGVHGFLADVGRDYLHMFSIENAEWAAVGGTATAAIHQADELLRSVTDQPTPYALKPGATYGNLAFQVPLAATWWIVGHAAGSSRGADAGRDLVRAQISAMSWTYAIKYSVNRTRPNGDPRSFPSGHTSATFATAMVLQEHYGWKVGLPIFGAAAYTGAERVMNDKHWASDVAFGAVVGILAGRTVTVHVRHQRLSIQPQAVPGGGGITIHVNQ